MKSRQSSLLLVFAMGAAHAQGMPWRVCLPDLVAPPYLSADPARPGIVERLLVDAGRPSGLQVQLLRYPAKRCVALLEAGAIEASAGAPIALNTGRFSFPMKDGAVDTTRYLLRTPLLWIKRRDSAFSWDGRQLGPAMAASAPLVGTRFGVQVAAQAAQALGLTVDDKALSMHQLLAKLAARRVDLVLAFQHEVEHGLSEPEFAQQLVVLSKPLQTINFYAVLPAAPSRAQLAQAELWWREIARLRELPAYQPALSR